MVSNKKRRTKKNLPLPQPIQPDAIKIDIKHGKVAQSVQEEDDAFIEKEEDSQPNDKPILEEDKNLALKNKVLLAEEKAVDEFLLKLTKGKETPTDQLLSPLSHLDEKGKLIYFERFLKICSPANSDDWNHFRKTLANLDSQTEEELALLITTKTENPGKTCHQWIESLTNPNHDQSKEHRNRILEIIIPILERIGTVGNNLRKIPLAALLSFFLIYNQKRHYRPFMRLSTVIFLPIKN